MSKSKFISKRQTFWCCPTVSIFQSGVLFLASQFWSAGSRDRCGLAERRNRRRQDGVRIWVLRTQMNWQKRSRNRYFASDLYAHLNSRRGEIRDYATERHSWDVVGQMTMSVYASLLNIPYPQQVLELRGPEPLFRCESPFMNFSVATLAADV